MKNLLKLKEKYKKEAKKVTEIYLLKGAYNEKYNNQVDIAMNIWEKIIKLERKLFGCTLDKQK